MSTKWKWLLIIGGIILFYFASGLSQHYEPPAVLGGMVIGCAVTFLFGKAKEEAQHNANVNAQNVNVSLNQHKINIGGNEFSEQQYTAIAEIVDRVLENKQLITQQSHSLPEPDGNDNSDQLMSVLRRLRQQQ